jgi:AraC-like DNA-binding protein/quercetin dioxygenase-like cupin family protein
MDFDRRNTKERRILDFSGTPISDVEVVGRYNYVAPHAGPPSERFPGHLEIIYLEQGEQPYLIDGSEYLLRSNELLIVYPGEEHSTGAVPENRGRLYWVILKATAKHGRWLGLAPPFGAELLRRLLDPGLPRRFQAEPSARALLERVLSAGDPDHRPASLKAQELWWGLRMQHKLVECLLAVVASREQTPKSFPTGRILKIANAISEDPAKPRSVGALAEEAGLSVPQFQRRFKEEIGLPPMEYVTRRRIEHATELLQATGRSITQIALDVGYFSSQYFATVFKKFTGDTPTAYRNRLRSRK